MLDDEDVASLSPVLAEYQACMKSEQRASPEALELVEKGKGILLDRLQADQRDKFSAFLNKVSSFFPFKDETNQFTCTECRGFSWKL